MKSIRVAAAVIQSVNEVREPVVFATQRGHGDYKDWWEFPGGKIEAGESPEAALKREIREELDAAISVERYLTTVEYDYPAFHLSMDCFWCRLKEGHLTLLEHEAARWLPLTDLRQVNWLPADIKVIEAIEKELTGLAPEKEGLMNSETIARIRKFKEDRDWDQFHSPANLAKSIAIEACELLECFQWDEETYDLEHVKEELADVLVYCQDMLDKLGLDADEIVNAKMDKNEAKYPVEKARGSAAKYTEL